MSETPTIEKPPHKHWCTPPAIGGSPARVWPDGEYLLDGDRWTCDCGRVWVARTLYFRRGGPMIWVRPAPWMRAWWSSVFPLAPPEMGGPP